MRRAVLSLLFAWVAALAQAQPAPPPYPLGPDSQRHAGVPRGAVARHTWAKSKIYPGTTRDYWVYTPAQYRPGKPACAMIFQDGAGLIAGDGRWRVPIVFDNLIGKGQMPVTVAIMIDPGVLPASTPAEQARFNRSFEYDSLGPTYARFLIEEIIPEVRKSLNLSRNPNDWAVAGSSSGAICAFTAAWNRPDSFRRVLSFIGSYTDLRGGVNYPALIRKSEPKPLRVFLQDGEKDLNIYAGNWFLANQAMASALDYAGYDYKFVTGTEAHNGVHGSAILPEALRWLWRDWPKPIANTPRPADRFFAREILDPAAPNWEQVSEGHKFTEGPAVDKDGNVYFSDIEANRIYRLPATGGAATVFRQDTGESNGLMFGADGRLYACQNGRRRITAYTADGAEQVLAEDVDSNDIAVTARGDVYFTDPPNGRIWLIDRQRTKRVVFEVKRNFMPNGIRLSLDHKLLLVADTLGRFVGSFEIQPDGSLANLETFYRLETPDEQSVSGADGMTLDSEGYLYVATRIGIQVCDQPGRVVAILAPPPAASVSNLVFGGAGLEYLYVTAGDKVFRRHLRRRGVLPWIPVKPPRPRL
jgi:gluconolactonase